MPGPYRIHFCRPITPLMSEIDPLRAEWMLGRFRRLMQELDRGTIARNTFEPWEVDLLIDILQWELKGRGRWGLLRQYRRAVERQLESGQGPPMKLSEFLALRDKRRELRAQQKTTRRP